MSKNPNGRNVRAWGALALMVAGIIFTAGITYAAIVDHEKRITAVEKGYGAMRDDVVRIRTILEENEKREGRPTPKEIEP